MDYFDNVHVWKLIHVCYFLLFPNSSLTLEEDFQDFTVRYGLKKCVNGVYKTNTDCSFIRGMVKNYCTLGKIQPWPTIHLGPTGLGE